MRARLKAKARRWKITALKATKRHRRQREQIRRQQRRIARLEDRIAQLEELTQPRRVAGHKFPAQLMAMAVFMVVHANVSLRGAAKSVAYFARLMNWTVDTPNHVTVLRWVLRAGLYQLQESARERTGRFAAIMDESISLGGEKLLLTLGVRLTDGVFDEQRPLSHQDVEVLAMQISPMDVPLKLTPQLRFRLTP